jgi:hypothetical protein
MAFWLFNVKEVLKMRKLVSVPLLVLSLFLLLGCTQGNISGQAVAVANNLNSEELSEAFVPCPAMFKNQACIRGSAAQIEFSPLFQIWNVPENSFVEARLNWGGQPECVYQRDGDAHIYRQQGRIVLGSNCVPQGAGFLCQTN